MNTSTSSALLLTDLARKRLNRIKQKPAIDHWPYDRWLKTLFPKMYSKPFASHHREFWQYVEAIDDSKPPAYFLVLARGGGKDANAQGAIVRLGATGKRRFCLYVCATQDLANKAVQTLGAMLESKAVEQYYPALASRQMGKYGHSKGWRVDMLRCGNGFNVVALGLDASVRGLRLDEFRPDLMVFSDVDSRRDTPEAIQKKIDTLTLDILPAGTDNTAVIFVQNLMHEPGIINSVVTGKAKFLMERIVNGPVKAVDDLRVEQGEDGLYQITGGTATWEGQPLEVCQAAINESGYTNFLIESQHEIDLVEGGFYQDIAFRRCNRNEVPDLLSVVCFCDPAVTDDGDKQGIQIDGLGSDDKIYRLYSWEQNSSPTETIKQAIAKAVEYGCDTIGFETDQGGDLWEESYNHLWEELVEDSDYPQITWDTVQPDFVPVRAGAIGSKKHRGQLMVSEYEKGRFIHVRGTSHILEAALQRFPKRKPFDLHDAAFWSMWELLENAPASN